MREKLHRLLHWKEYELREQLFGLILIVGLLVSVTAIIAGFALENYLVNALMLCSLVMILLVAFVATFKYHKIDFAAMLFAVFFRLCFLQVEGFRAARRSGLCLGFCIFF